MICGDGWSFDAHKSLGRDDFSQIPNGVPGVEERMTMAWQGVVRGLFDPCRFVEITAPGPARNFGLMWPISGSMALRRLRSFANTGVMPRR